MAGDSLPSSEDFSIIDTRKIHGTPSNGQIKNNSRESIAFLELEDDGTVRSEPVEKQLFEGKEIKFNPQKDLNLGMFLILEQFAPDQQICRYNHL